MAQRSGPPIGSVADAPRRLPWHARHEQLTAAAMPIVARHGFAEFSLDEVTSQAGVTRKLLYHYFPRGRPDVVLAVAERAGHQLTDDWIVDEDLPLDRRLTANVGRIVEHAMQPSDAWRIYRLARAASDPEINNVVERFVEVVIASISQNHLGVRRPPPLPRLAIRGYLALFESVLDDARSARVPLDAVLRMLNETLVAAVASALEASAETGPTQN
jgi:AcrR family transcriptional regulator